MKVDKSYFITDEEYKSYYIYRGSKICSRCNKSRDEHCRCDHCEVSGLSHGEQPYGIYSPNSPEMEDIAIRIEKYHNSWSNERQCHWVDG